MSKITVAVFGVVCFALVLLGMGYHAAWKPTPNQLYGCTLKQQAPNGDCP